jgi:hypothetical protein
MSYSTIFMMCVVAMFEYNFSHRKAIKKPIIGVNFCMFPYSYWTIAFLHILSLITFNATVEDSEHIEPPSMLMLVVGALYGETQAEDLMLKYRVSLITISGSS